MERKKKEQMLEKLCAETGVGTQEASLLMTLAKNDYLTAIGIHVITKMQNERKGLCGKKREKRNFENLNNESFQKEKGSKYYKTVEPKSNLASMANISFNEKMDNNFETNVKQKIFQKQNPVYHLISCEQQKTKNSKKNLTLGNFTNEDHSLQRKENEKGIDVRLGSKRNPKTKQENRKKSIQPKKKNKRTRKTKPKKITEFEVAQIQQNKLSFKTFESLKEYMTTDPTPRWIERFDAFHSYDPSLITNWPEGLLRNQPITIDKRFFTLYNQFLPKMKPKNLQRGMTYFFEGHGLSNCSKFHRKKMIFQKIDKNKNSQKQNKKPNQKNRKGNKKGKGRGKEKEK
ncbi:hypothetical protein M0813_10087 [Anaeramoeba flamelloides]|uniref:Uncharacterized protein n=1 Tax=Anaeramoeba flamelloides TaxID=1746091 RepID=A0ABQ8X4L5_9EUKA|nr:hypothetical protein M0813_10087 [Anaeramoeba flamelloides]